MGGKLPNVEDPLTRLLILIGIFVIGAPGKFCGDLTFGFNWSFDVSL